MTITIPGVPVPKGRPRFKKVGGYMVAYTPKKTTDAEDDIAKVVAATGVMPIAGPVRLTVAVFIPVTPSWSKKQKIAALSSPWAIVGGSGDADNYAKTVMDACNHILWDDDVQVAELHVTKRYSEEPRTVITVEGL